MTVLSYDAIRPIIKTGDIVLFSGSGPISSLIKLFAGGRWSHVGMVVRLTLNELDDTVLLWESTTLSKMKDIETGTQMKGVQLVPLSQRIANHKGDAAVRMLDRGLDARMVARLAECRRQLSRKPYERSKLQLLCAAWDGPLDRAGAEDLSSVFCSELVAEAYQAIGLLEEPPKGRPSNEYVPADFGTGRPLDLLAGYALGAELSLAKT